MVEDSSLAFLTHHFSSERLHLISGRRNFARYSQNIKHLYLRQEARIITVRASFFAKTNRFLSMILSQKIMMKEGRLHECNNHADMFPAVSWRTAIQLDYTVLQFKRIPYRGRICCQIPVLRGTEIQCQRCSRYTHRLAYFYAVFR